MPSKRLGRGGDSQAIRNLFNGPGSDSREGGHSGAGFLRRQRAPAFAGRLKQKQGQRAADDMIKRFKTDYLPFLAMQDLDTLLVTPKDKLADTMVKICMRIDLEREAK